MTRKYLAARLRRFLRRSRLVQIAALIGLWMLGEALVRVTGLPMPGSIAGLGLTLLLLAGGWVSRFSLRRGAAWFLGEMLLFFVPAVLAVIDHPEFLSSTGVKLLAIVAAGTIVVMVVTALTVELCLRWISSHADPERLS